MIEETITEGDRYAARCRITGTHLGDSLGVAPTRQRVDFTGMTMGRARGGQLVEGWNNFDFLALFEQIRLIKR